MSLKKDIQLSVDSLMVCCLLSLICYPIIDDATHEWLGMGMGALVLLHLFLNRGWLRVLRRGRYTPYRIVQTGVAALCALALMGMLCSGILLSNHLFPSLRVQRWAALAGQLHLGCAFWGFILMSLHFGLHWESLRNRAPLLEAPFDRFFFCAVGWGTALYGAFAFWKRHFPDYLLLRTHFLFFGDGERLDTYPIDLLAIMGLFIFCGHSVGKFLRRRTEGI